MRDAHPLEREVGIGWYVSDADGVGGRLRATPEAFRVRELERFDVEPADADPGDYSHLIVRATLRGWDTNAFARALSDRLGVSRGRIDWAGTKDADAVTTQLFSLQGVAPEDLPALSDVDLTVVGRAGRGLQFGDLAGNAFRVGVADADAPERADRITDELRDFGGGRVGVPNYFGHQRFGSVRPVTHVVGRHVVRREWEEAVLAYVGNPSEDERESTREARARAEREMRDADAPDWAALLERYPRRLSHERAILHALAENGGREPADFRDALEVLPWNLQRLFVNAVQSYAFNRMLNERLSRGLPFDAAVAGDVVCFAEDADGVALPDADRTQRVTERRVDTVNRHVERGRAFVTAPLVGTETELGEGAPGEIERDVLADLDLSPAEFDLPGEFHSTGTRRAVLVATDLQVEHDPLAFEFALPRGSYATVVLREYLKTDPLDL